MAFNIFLSILSGILSGLSFDFPSFSFLIWFSFSLLFYIFFKSKTPARYFFLAGVIFYSTVIFWLGFVTRLGTILLIFYLSMYWAVFAYLGKRVPLKFTIFILPVLWVGIEFIRENIPAFGFGWAILGYSQFKCLYLIQIADILGAKSISFIIITINIIITFLWLKKRGVFSHILYGVLLIGICWGYSFYKLHLYKPSQFIDVTVIQPNIPQGLKWNHQIQPFIIKELFQLGKKAKGNSLIIYPEASWPGLLDIDNRDSFIEWAKDLNKDILIGAVIRENRKFYNSVLLLNRDGKIESIYRKIVLVPFGEYVPLRNILGFISVFNTFGDISRGKDVTIFNYRNNRFGVLICFEDVFPSLVSNVSRNSDFLINITNDAWFKGNPEAIQHLSIMVLRAIENRISIVRCANTGISGFVDFLGRGYYLKKDSQRVLIKGIKTVSVPLNRENTLYNKWGDIFFVFCFFLFLGYLYRRKYEK